MSSPQLERPFAAAVTATTPVVVVAVSGDVDAHTVEGLSHALDGAIRDHDRHVVVDGCEVTFIDSTGMSTLLGAMKRLNRTRRRLALVPGAGGAPLHRALELSGLGHTFEVHPTLDAAVATLATAPHLGR
jgi:anti-sigma B factor antagonist